MRGVCAMYPALRRQMAKKTDSARESIATVGGSNIYSYNISIGYICIAYA